MSMSVVAQHDGAVVKTHAEAAAYIRSKGAGSLASTPALGPQAVHADSVPGEDASLRCNPASIS